MIGIAYGAYAATGEGLHIWLAVSYDKESVERLWKANVPEYFHRSLDVYDLNSTPESIKGLLPSFMQDVLKAVPCNLEFFTSYYENCS